MRVDETRCDPLVLAVNNLHPGRRGNVLLDASDAIALDEHIRLVHACILAALHAGRNRAALEQIFRHGRRVGTADLEVPCLRSLGCHYILVLACRRLRVSHPHRSRNLQRAAGNRIACANPQCMACLRHRKSSFSHLHNLRNQGAVELLGPRPDPRGRSTRRQELYQGRHSSNDILTGGWLDLASVLTSVKEKQHVERMDW